MQVNDGIPQRLGVKKDRGDAARGVIGNQGTESVGEGLVRPGVGIEGVLTTKVQLSLRRVDRSRHRVECSMRSCQEGRTGGHHGGWSGAGVVEGADGEARDEVGGVDSTGDVRVSRKVNDSAGHAGAHRGGGR